MSMTSTERVITRIRFSAELCGYHELKDIDFAARQKAFGDALLGFFKGRVPVGTTAPHIGVNARNSRDEKVGTAVVGDVLIFLGVEGEDAERACNAAVNDPALRKDFPIFWWEIITEESEKARQAEKARRKEYSAQLLAEKGKVLDPKARKRTLLPGSPVDLDDDTDLDDAF